MSVRTCRPVPPNPVPQKKGLQPHMACGGGRQAAGRERGPPEEDAGEGAGQDRVRGRSEGVFQEAGDDVNGGGGRCGRRCGARERWHCLRYRGLRNFFFSSLFFFFFPLQEIEILPFLCFPVSFFPSSPLITSACV